MVLQNLFSGLSLARPQALASPNAAYYEAVVEESLRARPKAWFIMLCFHSLLWCRTVRTKLIVLQICALTPRSAAMAGSRPQ